MEISSAHIPLIRIFLTALPCCKHGKHGFSDFPEVKYNDLVRASHESLSYYEIPILTNNLSPCHLKFK